MNNLTEIATEFEAKFYPVNKEEYREKLLSLGAQLLFPERKMRRSIGDLKTKPGFGKSIIRVRDEGNLVRLSIKQMAQEGGKMSDQKEIDVVVSDYDKTVRIIETLGTELDRYVENLRETWEYKGVEITIDTWPELEPYSEVEAHSEEEVKIIALELGLNWDKRIITSVYEIYAKVFHLDIEKVLTMVNNLTFETNPFSGMTRYEI
jgi:adenylate cyclase class IV